MTNRVLAALFALAVSVPAYAQDVPAYEASGGYSYLRFSGTGAHGWLASVTGNLSESLGITGEGGGNYVDGGASLHSIMGGVKINSRQNDRATPYVQALAGIVRTGMEGFDGSSDFAIQPGAGVDIWLNPNLAVRLGGDFRRIFYDGGGNNQVRFHIGIALASGRR